MLNANCLSNASFVQAVECFVSNCCTDLGSNIINANGSAVNFVSGGSRMLLELVRSTIRKALPDADEVISYQMPAYKLRGKIVVYFAGWKRH